MNPLNIVGSLIDGVVGVVNQRSQRKQLANTQRNNLIQSKETHNHSWEIAALEGEGWELPLIRMAAFIEVTLGSVITVYDPTQGAELWAALTLVPTWVIGCKVTIFGWAFGSTPIKNAAAGLVGSVINFGRK
jgi:hypothetical protein